MGIQPVARNAAGAPVIQTLLLILFLLTVPLPAMARQLIARVELGRYTLSLVATGDRYDSSCGLDLVAEAYQFRRAISLKHPFYNCAIYGAAQITAGHVPGEDTALVFVEGSRGGDGDHTPPIIEVLRLEPKGFKKLGKVELLDATYIRDKGKISAVAGKILFDFCDTCDGWEVSGHVVFVQAQVTISLDKLVVHPDLDQSGRAAVAAQFEAVMREALAEQDTAEYKAYVRRIERRFRDFLNQ